MDFFPHLGKAFAVNAQVPLTKIAERGAPDSIAGFLQALIQCRDERFGESGLSRVAAQMSEGMEHDVFEAAFVGEPFDMLERLAQHRRRAGVVAIAGFSVDEDDHSPSHFLLNIEIGDIGESLCMALPAETFGLKAEQFHGASVLVVFQKIFQQFFALFGENRFRMELYAFHRKKFVPHRHDDAVGSAGADG